MKGRAWFVYVLGGLALLAAWETFEPIRSGPVFNLIALTSPIAILVAVRIHRPEHRTPWYLFALGQTLFLVGNVITYNHELWLGEPLSFPSVGDAAFLAVYPCLIAGILLLIRERSPGRDREAFIDSLIIAVSVATVAWVYLLAPLTEDEAFGLVDKAVGVAYPLMDLVLLGTVVRLALGTGRRAASFWLMAAAAVSLLFTDFSHSYLAFRGVLYDRSGALEAGWALFFLFWAAAALHGSMRTVATRTPTGPRGLSEPRLALMALASLVAPVIHAVQTLRHETIDAQVLIGASAILFLLVVARMSGLVYAQQRSARRERALRESAGALVTATNRDGISVATMQAVRTLVGIDVTAGLLVNADEEEPSVLAAVATTGAADGMLGVEFDLRDLAEDVREGLTAGHGIEVRAPAVREIGRELGMPEEATHLLALPLFLKGDLKGVLAIAGAEPIPARVRESLQTLAAEVVLALESAELTEDLLRREGESRLSSLVQNSSDVVVVTDADSTLRYVSPSAERVLGYEPGSLEGRKLTSLIHADDRARVLTFMTTGDRHGDRRHAEALEFRLRHHDGTWRHVESLRSDLREDPNVRGIVLNTRDVSDRKAFEEQLKHQAFHDPITGLANRALFRDRVEHALERQTRDGRPVSVLFVDLDDFKTVNDSLGHEVGDELLRGVGTRLRETLRAADTSARLGGDEFAVLLEDSGNGVGAADAASRVLQALDAPFRLAGKDVFIRASIGIATVSSGTATSADELMRNADVAMYMAKEDGKSRYRVFEPAMHDAALRRLELKADLQRAIDNREFVLHYQPVIELETGEVSGVEALVRWQHPERGTVPPLDFIPLAEETGLIVPIGLWVLREACRQAVALDQRFHSDPPLHMAVNLSARQLQRRELVEEVAAILAETGLDPSRLVIEITESVMMEDMDLSIQRLVELKALGVRLAVDDFGTGYSSLNYIRRFPVDILKVDKSFIDEVSAGGEETVLAAAIIEIAGKLNLRPVAEGIERADQLDRLLDLNCELGQGFYFSKPMPIEGIDELLSARRALQTREAELTPQTPGSAP